jgi:hypothetical protein
VTELLTPDWQQPRPSPANVEDMWASIDIKRVDLPSQPFGNFIEHVRKSHDNGGAYLAAFDVAPDRVFDWYASRNRLSDDGCLEGFVTHYTVREALPELRIPSSIAPVSTCNNGFRQSDQFLLDGTFAHVLYNGGAYHNAQGDGRTEKKFALEVCDAMFGLRYGEISCYPNYDRWIPWFRGIAWDLTLVVFDRRTRRIWFLAVTDTD